MAYKESLAHGFPGQTQLQSLVSPSPSLSPLPDLAPDGSAPASDAPTHNNQRPPPTPSTPIPTSDHLCNDGQPLTPSAFLKSVECNRFSPYGLRIPSKRTDYLLLNRPWHKPRKSTPKVETTTPTSLKLEHESSGSGTPSCTASTSSPSSLGKKQRRAIPIIDLDMDEGKPSTLPMISNPSKTKLTPSKTSINSVSFFSTPKAHSDDADDIIVNLQSTLWKTRSALREAITRAEKAESVGKEVEESRERLEGILKLKMRECLQMTYDLGRARKELKAKALRGNDNGDGKVRTDQGNISGLFTPDASPGDTEMLDESVSSRLSEDVHGLPTTEPSISTNSSAASQSRILELERQLAEERQKSSTLKRALDNQGKRAESMKAMWMAAEAKADTAVKEVLRYEELLLGKD